MLRGLHGLKTANARDDNNTIHTPHAYEFLPTTHGVEHLQATFSDVHAPKQNIETPRGGVLGEIMLRNSTICWRLSAQAQG